MEVRTPLGIVRPGRKIEANRVEYANGALRIGLDFYMVIEPIEKEGWLIAYHTRDGDFVPLVELYPNGFKRDKKVVEYANGEFVHKYADYWKLKLAPTSVGKKLAMRYEFTSRVFPRFSGELELTHPSPDKEMELEPYE